MEALLTTNEDVENTDMEVSSYLEEMYHQEKHGGSSGLQENDRLLQKMSSSYGSVCSSNGKSCSRATSPPNPAAVPVQLGLHTRRISVGSAKLAERKNWLHTNRRLAALVDRLNNAGASYCILGNERQALAVFEVGDKIRHESRNVVKDLKQRAIMVYMLTGDNPGSAQQVGRLIEMEAENVYGGLLPEDKARHVEKLERPVAMVGDGVNDALSMVKADVSIGMYNENSKIATETADVALMRNNLGMVQQAVKLGRAVSRKLVFNLTLSILTKLVIVVLAFTVYPSLWLAIVADVVTMLVVTLNSMTLLSS